MTCTPLKSAKFTPPQAEEVRSLAFVLIACEESQAECTVFRAAGAVAFSCDIQDCSGGHPEWHFKGDVRNLFQVPNYFITQAGERVYIPRWDLVIAHPPCTYLSRAAGAFLYRGRHLNWERFRLGLLARRFFMEMYNAPAPFVCVENPVPFTIFKLPKPTCAVNPSDFGAPWLKKTLYWCRGLPPLILGVQHPCPRSFVHYTRGSVNRSKSFKVIAEAMAAQWLPLVKQNL